MKSPLLLIRADAGPQIGMGHVMRCLALAQAWQDAGGRACFVRAGAPDTFDERLAAEGIATHRHERVGGSSKDADVTHALARDLQAAAIVLDGYHFDTRFQSKLRGDPVPLLCVDDNAHAGEYVADWVLNQNLHAEAALYSRRAPHTRLLLGPQFALLRREFTRWRDWRRETPPRVRRLLVTLGGSDPDDVTGKVADALADMGMEGLETLLAIGGSNPHRQTLQQKASHFPASLRLECDSLRMPELMAWADVAVAGGGTTSWELAFMGLPAVMLVLAENQRAIAAGLDHAGIAVNLGEHDKLRGREITGALQRLLTDGQRRRTMSQLGRKLVDGFGSRRVVTALQC